MEAEVLRGKGKIFVLTDDALYMSNANKKALRAVGEQTRTGEDVRTAFPYATAIPYADVSSVRANRFGDHLTIYHGGLSALPTSSIDLTFKDASARDIALAALERHLAPRFQRREVQYGVVRAALGPLLLATFFVLFTYVAFEAAALVAAGDEAYFYKGGIEGRGRLLVPVFKLLRPTGVAILGGLAVLASIVTLVERVPRPPLMITLSPTE